jgi:hypothetical protein
MPKLLFVVMSFFFLGMPNVVSATESCDRYVQQCRVLCQANTTHPACARPQDCGFRGRICEVHRCWPGAAGVCIPVGSRWAEATEGQLRAREARR